MSVLDIIPKTCNATESPPKPSKNEQIITFVEIYFDAIKETFFTPLVNSIIPLKKALIKFLSIFNKLQIG